MRKFRSGFTLLEILIVLGMIAIFAGVIIMAINPEAQLASAVGRKRASHVREIENAITQYIIDGNALSGIPVSVGNARDICKDAVASADCTSTGTGYDLSFLVPNYLTVIPADEGRETNRVTGYKIYTTGSFIKACSPVIDSTCGSGA